MIAEAKFLEKLLEEFPDLDEDKRRGGNVWLTSSLVKECPDATLFTYHSCGCCSDAVLYATLRVKRGDKLVTCVPTDLYVGEKDPYRFNKYKFYDGYEENFLAHFGERGLALLREFVAEVEGQEEPEGDYDPEETTDE